MPSDPFDVYRTHEWFESLAWQHQWIEFMTGWWVGQYGKPRTMVDYGAGDGWWSHAFKQIGGDPVQTYAIELDAIAEKHIPQDVYFVQHDLREPMDILAGTFDLVICLEVAEHLPKIQAYNNLIATLAKSTAHLLLFSAAQPGQNGTGHVNLQPQGYWIEAIEKWSYLKLSGPRTAETRKAFKNICPEGLAFLPQNLLVFAKV